jgi:hypothetical protein
MSQRTSGQAARRCVHCLSDLPRKGPGQSADHAPPASWYPANVASHVQRPTAPACATCNASLRSVEDRLAILMLRFDVDDPTTRGLHGRFKSSYIASADVSQREREFRDRKRERLSKLARPLSEMSKLERSYPIDGFGPTGRHTWAVPMMSDDFDRFTEKMVRVLTHWRFREYVDLPRRVYSFKPAATTLDLARRFPGASRLQHGAGMTTVIVPFPLVGERLWCFRLWDRLNLAAVEGCDAMLWGHGTRRNQGR